MSVDLDLERQLRAALVGSEAGDWAAVQARMRRRAAWRLRLRGTGGLLAATLTLVVASQALGLGPQLSITGSTVRPSPSVLKSFGYVRRAGTGVYLAAETTTSDGRHIRLWVAPAAAGIGMCDALEVDGKARAGGCSAPGFAAGGLSRVGLGGPDEPMVDMGVGPPGTVQVRLRFADGRVVVLDSPRRGWLRERTADEPKYGQDLSHVEYLDRSGRPVR